MHDFGDQCNDYLNSTKQKNDFYDLRGKKVLKRIVEGFRRWVDLGDFE